MAVNKNFVVKNGLEVNTNLLVADLDTQTVGIGTTIAPHELHVVGGIGVTNLNVTGVATIANLRIGGISTFVGFTTFIGDVSVGGALTASTVTVQDLTNNRVVIAGTGGELEDSSNFRFDGSQLILGVGATVGGGLTVAGATDLNGALDISGEANFSSGVGIADSIFHIGDDNTQIRFPAADTVTVETGGDERLRVDSAGRLLLGTTTEGNASADNLTVADSANSGITIRSGTSNLGSIFFSDATSGNGEFAGFIDYNHSSNQMSFGTAENTRVTINSDGNIGIGTNDPNRRLVVRNGNGGTHSQAVASINLGDDSTFNDGILGVKNAGNRGTRGHANGSPLLNCEFSDGTGLILDKDGNLGIGTSNPTANNAVDAANEAVLAVGIATARKVFSDSLEVGGSQVISSARQLQNIASLDSTTTATIESAIANAPNTFTDLQITGIATFKNDVQFHGVAGITSISFDKSDNSLKFVDGAKARFGTGDDFFIEHDGTNTILRDIGTGNVFIGGDNDIRITNAALSEDKAKFTSNGAVELYYDNSKKFETTGFGATVFGQLKTQQFLAGVSTFTSTVKVEDLAPNRVVFVGAGDSLTDDANFTFDRSQLILGVGATVGGALTVTGATDLNGALDVSGEANFSSGVGIADSIFHIGDDNTQIRFPSADTFTVETGGTKRFEVDSSGNIIVGFAGNSLYWQNGFNDSNARIQNGGGSNNSNLIFYTRSSGTEAERLRITSAGDVDFKGANGITSMSFDRSSNSLDFVDNAKAQFGTGDDLQIYHNGTVSRIDNKCWRSSD